MAETKKTEEKTFPESPKKEMGATPNPAKTTPVGENPELVALRAELAALKKGQDAFEEKALEAACRAVGVSPDDFIAMQESKKSEEEKVEFDIGEIVVHINGVPFSGTGIVPRSQAEVILHMASMYRDQKMKAMIGRNYAVGGGLGGPISSRLLNTVQG